MPRQSSTGRLDSLSQYARRLLLGPHDAVEPPIRAELFGAQRFEQHGHSLAVRGDRLSLSPRVPAHWPGFEIRLRLGRRALTLQYGDATGGHSYPPTSRAADGSFGARCPTRPWCRVG
nr:glycosyl hydrolase family 65 protein [Variovorax paradoxus]